jgi:hypothetical protein
MPEWMVNYIGIVAAIAALFTVAHVWAKWFDRDSS